MTSARDLDRTDGVERKLSLLAAAYAAGRRDLAMSLAESIKDTLQFERTTAGESGSVRPLAPRRIRPGGRPPRRLGRLGSRLVLSSRPLAVRDRRPGTNRGAGDDPAWRPRRPGDRSVRGAARRAHRGRLEPSRSALPGRRRGPRRSRMAMPAPHPGRRARSTAGRRTSSSTAIRFAELPDYVTDLRVRGEGYGLEVANHHYVARLSRQMGQLERLISRREHGLELYAGGKGHGEPPGIDWAHDYVDRGGFQKLRMRNWAACPNFEVETGPLAVRVRRWGFPHSPVHPLFTPSRIHMDQTYTFYAGLPYFLKEGRMDVIQDVDVEAMRDDEWVFSGYSFTDTLWIDRAGKLHEGPVPAAEAE